MSGTGPPQYSNIMHNNAMQQNSQYPAACPDQQDIVNDDGEEHDQDQDQEGSGYSSTTSIAHHHHHHTTSSFAAASTGDYFDNINGGGGDASPFNMSPWHHSAASPFAASPWNQTSNLNNIGIGVDGSGGGSSTGGGPLPPTCLIGSLVREEGHIYSLAATGELLYTGSDSKNIRVWKRQQEFSGFKSSSGLVKAIIIAGDKIFSGHQDGKIRVWKVSPKDPTVHKRVGTLPTLKDFLKCSLKPSNYVEVRRHRNALWIRHYDAISCLNFSENQGLLYSGSWDKTFKVWRIADSKCLESVMAHDDAVNSVVAATGFHGGGLVFTGSADGTVKLWRRELHGKGTKHVSVQTLLKQESAVTTLAVSPTAPIIYSGSSDGLINFWEWEQSHHLSHGGVLRGHKLAVLCLAAAGNLVLSGSADKTICVWRREGSSHTCLSVLTGHGGPVKCLAIEDEDQYNGAAAAAVATNDDNANDSGGGGGGGGGATARYVVYSGSLDKSVKVWRVSEQAPEALLQGPQHMPADMA